MNTFDIGDRVTVISYGHQKDGRTGTVVYHSEFLGTIGVEIDGHHYGFFESELKMGRAA